MWALLRAESAGIRGCSAHATVGYVHRIDTASLQKWAERVNGTVVVAALPGMLAMPGKPMAFVHLDSENPTDLDCQQVVKAFDVGRNRLYDTDPRFGLVVLSQIAARALSAAINDPGTAIARDGAGSVEVAMRLQKALGSLASVGNAAMREAAIKHARLALARAERALTLPEDLAVVQDLAKFAQP